MSFASYALRAVVFVSLFAVQVAWAEEASPTNETLSVTTDFDGILAEGQSKTVSVEVTHRVQPPGVRVCDIPSGGWGCGGEADSCASYLTSYPPAVVTSVPAEEILGATCDDGCEATLSDSLPRTVRVTGKTANTKAKLTLRVRDHSGREVSTEIPIEVTPDTLRVVRSEETAQGPDDVFLAGQDFMWCVRLPGSRQGVRAAIEVAGEVEVLETSSGLPLGCGRFRSTKVGAGTITFTAEDGRTAAAEVSTVSPDEVVAVDFIDPRATGSERTDLAQAVVVERGVPGLSICTSPTARFTTYGGRFGLVRQRDFVQTRAPQVRLGSVTKTLAGCF